jgi:hypothetical protein
LLLFEKIINLVHGLAPAARICFNTTPADTVKAVSVGSGLEAAAIDSEAAI